MQIPTPKIVVLISTLIAGLLAITPATARQPEPNIVNGQAISITQAPWQVALLHSSVEDPQVAQFCGGSILNTEWIVTAAHCLVTDWSGDVNSPQDVQVLAGVTELSTPGAPRSDVQVVRIHPEYDRMTFENDIALLKLATPLVLDGTTMSAIHLPSFDPATWPAAGTPAFISGWGTTETGKGSDGLRAADIEVLTDPTDPVCGSNPTDQYLPSSMLCAGTTTDPIRDSCQGDSGGPLAIDVAGVWTLGGITSWGYACAQADYPGVYTRVTSFTDWITTTMNTPWAAVTGTVASSNGPVAEGDVEFYATCQDWHNRDYAARAHFIDTYNTSMRPGDYRVRIVPYYYVHDAMRSWHNAKADCGSANIVTVTPGANTRDLVARPGAIVSGSVVNSEHLPIKGSLEFYATCRDWENGEISGQVAFDDRYTLAMPAGDYRVRIINTAGDATDVASWHSAKPTCGQADVVSIPADQGDYTRDLVALSVAPDPTPSPTPTPTPTPTPSPIDQSLNAPPKSMRVGSQISLARRTAQRQTVTWKSRTKKICTVSRGGIRAKKRGSCRVRAEAAGTPALNAYRQVFTITIRRQR